MIANASLYFLKQEFHTYLESRGEIQTVLFKLRNENTRNCLAYISSVLSIGVIDTYIRSN